MNEERLPLWAEVAVLVFWLGFAWLNYEATFIGARAQAHAIAELRMGSGTP